MTRHFDGATGPSYTIPRDMEDDLLGVRVGFTDSHGFDESVASHEVVWRRVGEIWAALVTAKNKPNATFRNVGFGSRYPGSSLSDRTFTYRSNTYRVDDLQDADTPSGTIHSSFLSTKKWCKGKLKPGRLWPMEVSVPSRTPIFRPRLP